MTEHNVFQPRVVAVDITSLLPKDFVEDVGGQVWQLYVYDAGVATYLCEMAPSRELYYVDITTPKWPTEECGEDWTDAMSVATVEYLHVTDVNTRPTLVLEDHPIPDYILEIEDDDEREKAIDEEWEDVVEHIRANIGMYTPPITGGDQT